jgi:hypothetical protein
MGKEKMDVIEPTKKPEKSVKPVEIAANEKSPIHSKRNSLDNTINPSESQQKMQPPKTEKEGNNKVLETQVLPICKEGSQQSPKTVDQKVNNQKPSERSEGQNDKIGVSTFPNGLQKEVTPNTKTDKIPDKECTVEQKDNLKPKRQKTPAVQEVQVPPSRTLESEQKKADDSKKTDSKTELPHSQANNDNGVNKHKINEGPTSMQTLLVPKITEPQGQEKSHSGEGVGKHEKQISKLSPDVAKTLSDTKRSLKPTRGKVGLRI